MKKKEKKKKGKLELKWFEVIGEKIIKGKPVKFTKTVPALNENAAREKVLSLMGSKHKVKRRFISIHELKRKTEK